MGLHFAVDGVSNAVVFVTQGSQVLRIVSACETEPLAVMNLRGQA